MRQHIQPVGAPVRRLAPLLLVLTVAACLTRVPAVPVESDVIPYRASPAAAQVAATEGLEDAGLDVDPRGPGLFTAWLASEPLGTRLAPSRRVAIRVRVDPGVILVRPLVEECTDGICRPVESLLPEEARLVRRVVSSIRARLDVLDTSSEPAAVSAVERQATRDPARPIGRGPVAVSTRAGPTEVVAGVHVDAVLVNGASVSGRVLGVSTDGVTIEIVPGREVVLWAGDLASLRVRY